MSLTVHVPKPDTPARRLAALEWKGAYGRLPGGRVADCVEQRQMISLCPLCVGKFNPRRHEYELWRTVFTVARCDACKAHDIRCKSFIHQSLHADVGDHGRRRGRWASR